MSKDKRPRRRKRSRVSTYIASVVIVLAIGVMAVSILKLVGIFGEYHKANSAYAEIEKMFLGDDSTLEDAGFVWDYQKLLDMCEDAVGYIYQKGTMSYPIVQADDNDKYLRHMMNGEYSVTGTIFVDFRCEDALDSDYAIIYGHNMDNDTIFGSLSKYDKEDYYKKHPYFDIYSKDKHYRYYVFSSFVTGVDGDVYITNRKDEEKKEYYDELRSRSPYETDVREITADDKIAILSTCVDWHDYSERYIVCLVRGEEIED